jgi:putative ABC transport system substrate-binding protein
VFVVGLDPIALGLVSSMNRPGGNATGVAFRVSALEPKRFELLRNLLPKLLSVGALVNPGNPNAESHVKDLRSAALGPQLVILEARNNADLDLAFSTVVKQRIGALLVTSDPFFQRQRSAPAAAYDAGVIRRAARRHDAFRLPHGAASQGRATIGH